MELSIPPRRQKVLPTGMKHGAGVDCRENLAISNLFFLKFFFSGSQGMAEGYRHLEIGKISRRYFQR